MRGEDVNCEQVVEPAVVPDYAAMLGVPMLGPKTWEVRAEVAESVAVKVSDKVSVVVDTACGRVFGVAIVTGIQRTSSSPFDLVELIGVSELGEVATA